MNFQHRYLKYKSLVDGYLKECVKETKPKSVYQPIHYVLAGGGKRIRPLLVLLSCEAVGGKMRDALHASAGVEILHNFTLVHDDIMDHASSRRGRATIHTQWDENVAILVGDELLALAYRALLKTKSQHIQEITKTFTEGVVEVCEGQGYDKEFETRPRVSVQEYLLMIRKKTGKMVSVATEIGALIGNAQKKHLSALRRYGEYVGRAFQIQDDLLDVIADEKEFGKTIGGDLVEGKKTFLLLEAFRRAQGADKVLLSRVMKNGGIAKREVPAYRRIYYRTDAIGAARRFVERDIAKAKSELQRLPASNARTMLVWLTDMLLHRTY